MDKFFKKYLKNNDFVGLFAEIIEKYSFKKATNRKYSSLQYAQCIIDVLSYNSSWRGYKGIIDGRILNNKHNQLVKIGAYNELMELCQKSYFKKNKTSKLKYQSIDSSFVKNKYGTEMVKRNTYYKNKKGIKISTIVNEVGVPISIDIDSANKHDSNLFEPRLG